MADLNTLSNIAQIASEVGTVIAALGGAYYQYVIKPERKFKEDVLKSITTLENEFKSFKENLTGKFGDLEEEFKERDADELREMDHLEKDFLEFKRDTLDRFHRLDSKSEKLLDLIIKYFTDKE